MLEKIAKERRDYPEILKGKDRVITEINQETISIEIKEMSEYLEI